MANIFKPKRSNTPSSVPTTSDLADGELAVNSADKIIYLRDDTSIIEIANYNTGISSEFYWIQNDVGIHTLSNVGIGTTNPTSKLTVGGDGNFTGVVTATSFSGSGENLTGIVTSITAGTGVSVDQSNGNVTITASATEHKILDDISSSFDGSTTQFTITSSSTNFLNSEITSAARLLISVGGIVQQPDPTQTNGYYISGGTDLSTDPIKINFAEAPKVGQTFFGVAYGLTVSPTTAFTTAEQSIAYSIVFGV